MNPIDHVQFVRHRVSPIRRHYVDGNDVRVVLSRLPEELWSRLRKVHFKDDAKGNRILGYTTNRGRKEVSLCALPHQVTVRFRIMGGEAFGAVRGSPWPSLAVRRYMLYDVLLHELGHLQIVLPKSANPRRKFASETLAQEFADTWRRKLWSRPFDHPDPVHNRPSEAELRALKTGWIEANLAYKRGHGLYKARKYQEALPFVRQALELYPDHVLALERLGALLCFNLGNADGSTRWSEVLTRESVKLLRRAVTLDPLLPEASLTLAMALASLNEEEKSRCIFARAIDLDPYAPMARTLLAEAISLWGHAAEAEALFKQILKSSPDDLMAMLYYGRHLLYQAEKTPANDRRAVALLRRVVEADRKFSTDHYFLAVALSRLPGHTEEAIQHLREAVRLEPERENARKLLDELTSATDSAATSKE